MTEKPTGQPTHYARSEQDSLGICGVGPFEIQTWGNSYSTLELSSVTCMNCWKILQPKCTYCDRRAVCVGTSEGDDHHQPACSVCCAHGGDDMACKPIYGHCDNCNSDFVAYVYKYGKFCEDCNKTRSPEYLYLNQGMEGASWKKAAESLSLTSSDTSLPASAGSSTDGSEATAPASPKEENPSQSKDAEGNAKNTESGSFTHDHFGPSGILDAIHDLAIHKAVMEFFTTHSRGQSTETPLSRIAEDLKTAATAERHASFVQGCARCGQDHAMIWNTFSHPMEAGGQTFPFWAMCPNLSQPLLMRMESKLQPDEDRAESQPQEFIPTPETYPTEESLSHEAQGVQAAFSLCCLDFPGYDHTPAGISKTWDKLPEETKRRWRRMVRAAAKAERAAEAGNLRQSAEILREKEGEAQSEIARLQNCLQEAKARIKGLVRVVLEWEESGIKPEALDSLLHSLIGARAPGGYSLGQIAFEAAETWWDERIALGDKKDWSTLLPRDQGYWNAAADAVAALFEREGES